MGKKPKTVVFTDLDGTLLNHDDYDYQAAMPAMNKLKRLHIPLILVSSKTIDEIELIRKELNIDHPFVSENGSIVVVPIEFRALLRDYQGEIIENRQNLFCNMGRSRDEVLSVLDDLRDRYRFRGFSQMKDEEIAGLTGLSLEKAAYANHRLASEPIVWRGGHEDLIAFCEEINRSKLRVVSGGRFHHITGNTDKAKAVSVLDSVYRRYYGAEIHSIVLGDSENDLEMLKTASTAVVIPKVDGTHLNLENKEHVVYAVSPGSSGWGNAMEMLLKDMISN
jgi:mannosyl-3-phosphoglycerate phosphatase